MTEKTSAPKRKKLLTAYLILGVVSNIYMIIAYVFFPDRILQANPTIKPWVLPVLATVGAANLVCLIAVLNWRKWGFWGACILAVIVFLINQTWNSGLAGLLGLLGPLILYALLQYGKEQKAWPWLR